MQPSSVVFVIVIAVWAAFLVQSWVARRDHLATARTADRFSQAMRILDLHPARAVDSPSHVGRIEAHPPVRRTGLERPHDAQTATLQRPGPEEESGATCRGRAATQGPPAADQTRVPRRRRLGQMMRGLTFLVALVSLPATGWLSYTGVLHPLAPAVAAGLLLLAYVVMRRGVVARRRQRRLDARQRRVLPAHGADGAHANPADGAHANPADDDRLRAPDLRVSEVVAADVPAVADHPPALGVEKPYDLVSIEAAETAVRAASAPVAEPEPAARRWPELDEDDMPLTWDPVPVPQPTYTMKARAYYPPEPAVPSSRPPAAQVAEPAYPRQRQPRSAAGG